MKPSYRGDGIGHVVQIVVGYKERWVTIPLRSKDGSENFFRKKVKESIKKVYRWNGSDWELKGG